MFPEYKTKIECLFCKPITADKLFEDLPAEALESLARIKRKTQIEEGAFIFTKDKTPQGIYILREGQAQMLFNNKRPARHTERNEILGLTGMISELPCEISVRAVSPCDFDYIEREDFINFLKAESEVSFRLVKTLGANLQQIYQLVCSSTI
jgi:CRP-like cAMP-binding protein